MLDVAAGRLGTWRRGWLWLLLGGLIGLFAGYYRMALTVPTTADGAGNALQAFDLIHRNPLLHGWTVSDVSFYGVELFQFAAIERVIGLSPQVAPASAALSYAVIVLLVGLLAKGRVPGRAVWLRVGLAVSLVLLPEPGVGQAVLLGGPDHTGAAVPLLLAWLLLDRAGRVRPRWLPYAVAAVLAWGQLADPVLSLVGAVPLVVVCLARTIRGRAWRAPDAALAVAGVVSVPIGYGAVWLIGRLGGYRTQAVPTDLVPWRQLGSQLKTAAESVTVLFGCHFPELHGWFERSLGVLHLLGLCLVVIAVLRTVRLAWRGVGDRVDQVIVAGILVNLAAFVWSALNINLLASHEIAPVLPLSAVLVARVLGRPDGYRPGWLTGTAPRILALGVAGFLVAGFIGQAGRPAVRPSGMAVADWLASRQLNYGLGGYWVANSISVDSGGAVQVVPLNGISHITGYRWESRRDWYDPAKHDARFIVLQLNSPSFFTVDVAIAQFGQPVDRVTLPTSTSGNATVLVYDRNLLVGLPAWCAPGREASSMAAC